MSKILNMKEKMEESIEDAKEDRLRDLEKITKAKTKKKKNRVVVEFSWEFLIALGLILSLVFFSKQLVVIAVFLFVGFVLMSASKPLVKWLTNRKISKGWAVFLIYFFGSLIFLSVLAAIIVPFVSEFKILMESFPQWIDEFIKIREINILGYTIDLRMFEKSLDNYLSDISISKGFENIVGTVTGAFGWFTILLTAVIFSIYLLLDHDTLLDIALLRIPSDKKRDRVRKLVIDLEDRLGSWVLGQLTVSTIAGLTIGITLSLLKIPFALPLGVLIFLLSAIPNLGSTISTIPGVLVALFTYGFGHAVLILAIYLLYQQIENNLIIPKVMGNALGIRPVIVMLGVIVFFALFGIFGALIAVPVMVIAQIVYDFYLDLQKLTAEGIV